MHPHPDPALAGTGASSSTLAEQHEETTVLLVLLREILAAELAVEEHLQDEGEQAQAPSQQDAAEALALFVRVVDEEEQPQAILRVI